MLPLDAKEDYTGVDETEMISFLFHAHLILLSIQVKTFFHSCYKIYLHH
jgi:hypothetical protein